MKFLYIHLLTSFLFTSIMGQPKTKQVLVEGNGPPLVLLHGGTFDYHAFEVHAKLLADSFTVIRMQQFNVQAADQGWKLPTNYSVAMESDAIMATLDSLHISAPVVLVGHSYGGVVAFDFSMRFPTRIKALVLVEAPLFDIAKINGKYSFPMMEIDKLTRDFSPQAIITEKMIKAFRCKMTNCDTFDIRQHPMWPKWLQQKDRLKGLSVVSSYTIDPLEIKAFQPPVLLVTGTQTIEPNQTVDSLLAKEFPHASTASLKGGHIAVYQDPQSFTSILVKFLKGN